MKIQVSTARTLADALIDAVSNADSDAAEIALSPQAEALIRDVVARDELQVEIDKH